MAARSRDALPVLEEWYDGPVSGERPCNRPRACGVVGCAEPLVTARNRKYHLCAVAHQVPRGAAPRHAAALVFKLLQVSFDQGVQRQPQVRACLPRAGSAVLTHNLTLFCKGIPAQIAWCSGQLE